MQRIFAIFVLFVVANPAFASVIRVSDSDFVSGSGLITFSEYDLGVSNPFYTPATYGGAADSPNVTFDGWFSGQSLSANPADDCPGSAATACVVGNPTGGNLTLDATSPDTFITTDGSNPTSPVLSGSPKFDGPIAILFSEDQLGVGFDGGYFNAVGSTAITAFARDGSLIGSVSNTGEGIEFLGLVTDDNTPQIAGVFLDLVGSEPYGFAVDNIRFGKEGQVRVPNVPEPQGVAIFLLGLAVLLAARKRTR